MPLILTTPPAADPVSLAEAKAHLRVSHADDDAYITRLIAAARRAVELASGLRLVTQGWSLFTDRWPDDPALPLQVWPVTAISDIITYGEDDTPALLDPAYYYLDHAARPARAVLRHGRTPPRGGRPVNAIEVRFTAGFGAASSVPEELRQAILLTVANWFDHRGDGDGGVLPLAAVELLAAHRSVRLA